MPVDARPPAGRDEQPVAAQLVARPGTRARTRRPRGARPTACWPKQSSMPSAASASAERLAERLGLARQHVVHALDERHRAAHARDGLRHLDADGPAAQHEQPARHLGERRWPRGWSRRRRARAGPATGGITGSEPVAITTSRGRVASRRPPTPARARRGAPAPRSTSMPLPVEPRRLAGVVVVRDHEVAPREAPRRRRRRRSPPRARPAPRAPPAAPRPGAAASWTGCRPSSRTRRRAARARRSRPAARRRRAGRRSARRPGPAPMTITS